MNNVNILSKDHFAAHQQVVSDYKLLIICEKELATNTERKKTTTSKRLKKEIILILERIIANKNILTENTKADQEYLHSLTNIV
jgi:hypothetical protein